MANLKDVNISGTTTSQGSASYAGNVSAPDFIITSDSRIKTDITKVNDVRNRMFLLNGYTYFKRGQSDAGLLAQEAEKALEQSVSIVPDRIGGINDLKAISHSTLSALYVEAHKEHYREVDELKTTIEEMKRSMEELKTSVSEIKGHPSK